LENRGFHVTAVQLPLTSVAEDVATVKRAIELDPGPLLLVGHSYAGIVITEAGNDPKVSGLVSGGQSTTWRSTAVFCDGLRSVAAKTLAWTVATR
jgi:hypothetical protein